MTKLTFAPTAAAVLLGGFLLLQSDATALPVIVGASAATKNYSSIQKAGCFLADAIVAWDFNGFAVHRLAYDQESGG